MKRAKGELFCGIVAAIIYSIGIIVFFFNLAVGRISRGAIVLGIAFVIGSLFVVLVHILHRGVKDDDE